MNKELLQQCIDAKNAVHKHYMGQVMPDAVYQLFSLVRDDVIPALAQQDRHVLQAEGKHPAPCAGNCEANAFQNEIRGLKSQIKAQQEQPAQEPEAWLIPSLASFKDAKSVSFSRVEGCTLTDAQLIEKMSGEVLWRVEVFSDGDGVIDKHGAHHAPKPLYTRPALTQPEEDFCYCNKNVSLQMVSGGGAPEGYLGMVTLRIGDQYRDYYTHPPTQPALSDDEILNCFYASKSEGMASYMLAVGRAIEAHCRGGASK